MAIRTVQIDVAENVFDAQAAGAADAPFVLMLHGFPQTSHSWRHQLQPLADAGFHALAPDQRGYSAGARPLDVAQYATALLLEDALNIMDQLGDQRAHIVGHDWGGQLSWLLAAFHPERVQSLTVLSRPHPQAFRDSLRVDAAQAERSKHHQAFQNPEAAQWLLADNAQRLRALYTEQGVPAADQEAYLRVLGSFPALDAAINWYRAAASGSDQPLAAGKVPDITVPTLYLWGDRDATVGRTAAEATAQHVSADYRFEVLPGIGHFITDQLADPVTALLLEHLQDHAGD